VEEVKFTSVGTGSHLTSGIEGVRVLVKLIKQWKAIKRVGAKKDLSKLLYFLLTKRGEQLRALLQKCVTASSVKWSPPQQCFVIHVTLSGD
jgi:hypothetical protein